MAVPTYEDMVDQIEAGDPVLFNGKIYYTVEELPTQEEIDAVYEVAVGKSAYDLAVDNGFVGTEEEWLATLVGPAGADGEDGAQGIQGEQGETGPPGAGSGDTNGPASAVNNNVAVFDGTTGKLLKDGGATLASKQNALGFTAVPDTRTVAGHALSSDVTVSKSDVGLGSVDNTADTAKPVSTAQQTALNLKADLASPTFTGTVSGITKSMVGLGSVDNTADTAKPVSTAQQTAIDAKVDDTAYDATSWNGATTVAPSKNAVRDKIEALTIPVVSDTAYDATTWNGNTDAPTKNAVRDKFESLGAGSGPSVIFVATADASTVTNGTTGTLFGTGTGSLTLAANALTVGKSYRIQIGGKFNDGSGNQSRNFKFKLGSTDVATQTGGAAAGTGFGAGNNLHFFLELIFTCISTGGSGTVNAHGVCNIESRDVYTFGTTTAVTIDTTTTQTMDITVGIVNGNMTGMTAVVESLN